MEIEPNFPPAPVVRTQRTRRQFNYEARDEPSVDPLSKFRTEFFLLHFGYCFEFSKRKV